MHEKNGAIFIAITHWARLASIAIEMEHTLDVLRRVRRYRMIGTQKCGGTHQSQQQQHQHRMFVFVTKLRGGGGKVTPARVCYSYLHFRNVISIWWNISWSLMIILVS